MVAGDPRSSGLGPGAARSVLGVDPGTRNVGWAIVRDEGGRLTAIDFGTIKARANQPIASRLLVIGNALRVVVATHRPDEAAIEEAFYGRDARSAQRIGEARGAILLVLAEAGLPVQGYANNTVKKAVTGVGRAAKGQVQSMMQRILRLETPIASNDASDALAIAVCHHQRRGLPGNQSDLPERIAAALKKQASRQQSRSQEARGKASGGQGSGGRGSGGRGSGGRPSASPKVRTPSVGPRRGRPPTPPSGGR